MIARFLILLLFGVAFKPAFATEVLVMDLDLESDLLSLSHNIDNFLFAPTRNFTATGDRDLNESVRVDAMRNYLAVTAMVRIGGEIAGFATEQEVVQADPETGMPVAYSAWLITLNHPGYSGVLAVTQKEAAHGVFDLAQRVAADPDAQWEDRWERFLSTSGEARVGIASGELGPYADGLFEEYNYLNPSDLKNFAQFRARIQFVIHPRE